MKRLNVWVFVIITLALVLRLTWINLPLWGDEIASVIVARLPLSELAKYYSFDPHPPLFYSTLRLLQKIGISDQMLKIVPLSYSLATILLVYVILLKLNKPSLATICSLFLAISPLHIYLGAELRGVGAATFWATLALYLLINWLNSNSATSPKALWLTVAIASLHHYYALFFFLAVVVIPFVIGFSKKRLIVYFKGMIWALIPWIVWMPFFISQALHGQSFRDLFSLERLVFLSTSSLTINGCPWRVQDLFGLFPTNTKGFFFLLMFSLLFFAVLAIGFWKKNYWTDPLKIWFFLSFASAFAVSNAIPIFAPKYIGVFLPSFLIGVALGINELANFKKSLSVIITFLLGTILFTFALDLNFNPKNRPPNWEKFMLIFNKEVKPTDMILTYGEWASSDFFYYYRRFSKEQIKSIEIIGPIQPGVIPIVTNNQLKALELKLESANRVWFNTQLCMFADPQSRVEELLSTLFPNRKEWIINEEMKIFIYLYWR